MRWHLLVLLPLHLLAQFHPALAAEEWKADPSGYWRYLTSDDGTTTSRCIGTLNSPVCAVETSKACTVRHQPELCRIARGEAQAAKAVDVPKQENVIPASYRIIEIRSPVPEDVPEFDDRFLLLEATDIVVGVTERIFNAGQRGNQWIDPPVDERVRYLVRKQGQGWTVLGHYTARPDLPPKRTPPDMRTLGDGPASSSSTCIGRLSEPVCAVETAFAGKEWQNGALLDYARGTGPLPPLPWDARGYRLKVHYRIVDTRAPAPSDAGLFSVTPAGHDVVVELDAECVQRPCEMPADGPTAYLVRELAGEWRVIEWAKPRT